jgi:hypothetical protein
MLNVYDSAAATQTRFSSPIPPTIVSITPQCSGAREPVGFLPVIRNHEPVGPRRGAFTISRVYLSPAGEALANVLNQNVSRYESTFGKSSGTKQPGSIP